MSLFTSTSETLYWKLAAITVCFILSPLFIPIPWSGWFDDDQMAFLFLVGMLLVGLSVVFELWKQNASWVTLVIVMGLIAVIYMFLLRLTMAERSHLIEYTVLTLFVFKAMSIRNHDRAGASIFLNTFWWCFGVSFVDEVLQLFIPHRVFDTNDILFNALAISGCLFFLWFVPLFRKKIKGN